MAARRDRRLGEREHGRARPARLAGAVAKSYFKQGEDFFRNYSVDETLALMDALRRREGDPHHRPRASLGARAGSFPKARPDRFFLGAQLDPRRGMKRAARARGVLPRPAGGAGAHHALRDRPRPRASRATTRCTPSASSSASRSRSTPGSRARRRPPTCQHPLHLDRVCLHFPELVAGDGPRRRPVVERRDPADAQVPEPDLMTSAYAPRYFPPELLHFMNTRGQDKVIFASDHPAIPMQRCVERGARPRAPRPASSRSSSTRTPSGCSSRGASRRRCRRRLRRRPRRRRRRCRRDGRRGLRARPRGR